MEELISDATAALLLGVSAQTVRSWQARGLLARVDGPGGQRLVPAADVARYQREQHERAVWRQEIRARFAVPAGGDQ